MDHIRREIRLHHRGGRHVHADVFDLGHVEADQHERRQQKKHNVDQRNDLDPRVLAMDWRGKAHEPYRSFSCKRCRMRLIITSTLDAAVSSSYCNSATLPPK